MRRIVAKRLRKEANKISNSSKSNMKWHQRIIKGKDGKPKLDTCGTLSYSGNRRVYQDLKKAHRNRQ